MAIEDKDCCYELSETARELNMDEITLIRSYIYKCSGGDDKWAGRWFVQCMTINYASDEVLELARKGEPIEKDRLSTKIYYADYD
ncbi:MAG: hypothetical protein LUE27_06505 [Clostridia bacterium]|nr:hypothetical protein [Clostridia bacterium]